MQLVFHPAAADELVAAYDWYRSHSSQLAADFAVEVERAVALIQERPRLWQRWPNTPRSLDVRRCLLRRFPFGIAFTVEGETMQVVAFAHLHRRPRYWARRLRGRVRSR